MSMPIYVTCQKSLESFLALAAVTELCSKTSSLQLYSISFTIVVINFNNIIQTHVTCTSSKLICILLAGSDMLIQRATVCELEWKSINLDKKQSYNPFREVLFWILFTCFLMIYNIFRPSSFLASSYWNAKLCL